jgi:hypothetical protein
MPLGLRWGAGLVALGSEALAVAGYVFCLSVPAQRGARGLAIATLALGGTALLLQLVSFVLSVATGEAAAAAAVARTGPGRVFEMLGGGLTLVKLFVFLFFLRAVATLLRADGVARSVRGLTILSAIALAGAFLLILVAIVGVVGLAATAAAGPEKINPAAAGGFAVALLVCGCPELLLGLGAFVWYIVVLAQVRGAISGYLDRV